VNRVWFGVYYLVIYVKTFLSAIVSRILWYLSDGGDISDSGTFWVGMRLSGGDSYCAVSQCVTAVGSKCHLPEVSPSVSGTLDSETSLIISGRNKTRY
jgi:hypothetical protein